MTDGKKKQETESSTTRYVVGIDLGTTNSAMAYVDTSKPSRGIEIFAVPQLIAPGQIESRETLPSFHYQPASAELAGDAMCLPWQTELTSGVVGVFARDHGSLVPGRMIASAKSWLCHSGVDRTADLLPWHGAEDVKRLSPIAVSACYLRHFREAWNAHFPKEPLEKQEIILTLPASFDEVARELTVRAAADAGLPKVVLIEEPQAAFYAWLDRNADDWEERVSPGDKILVCDVGGGTSDLTLIRVRRDRDGRIVFHRTAVGDHVILGGDNLDLALAHHVERQLTSGTLEPRQWDVLVSSCRRVKEEMLGPRAPESTTLTLPGSGSRLIGGSLSVEVKRDDVVRLLVEGFLPRTGLEDKPAARASGFQEFGLPYAPDAAISKYLAAFLTAHRDAACREDADADIGVDSARPDIVLLNGGFFESSVLRDRLLDVLRSWFCEDDPDYAPIVLANDRLDLAVARGAAYYGLVRRGEGVRIAAGLARTYYIGVDSDPPAAVCLVSAEAEPGEEIELADRVLQLRVAEPVQFPLFVSSTRLTDAAGELIPVNPEEMKALPPIRTVLRTRAVTGTDVVPVRLQTRLTEIGTVELWCGEADGRRRWRLEFDVRSATQTDMAPHQSAAEAEGYLDETTWQQCYDAVAATFDADKPSKPGALVKNLSRAILASRNQWPASLCRRLWSTLMEFEHGRKISQPHEARWLNLLGFTLRPGYGLALDDWRVAETWNLIQKKLYHPCRDESMILWRRVGGGLSAGQQQAVASPFLPAIRALHRRSMTGKRRGSEYVLRPEDSAEVWRLLGALELLDVATKTELGTILLDLMPKRKMQSVLPAMIWTLGRLGTRTPAYGPLNAIVAADAVSEWLIQFMKMAGGDSVDQFTVVQLACRTDDRYRDIPDKLRGRVMKWLRSMDAPNHYLSLVERGGRLDRDDRNRVFGESLPQGLSLS